MANRIKQLREERRLSQEMLGKLANTSGQQIGLLEKSKRRLTVDWCKRLAAAMKIEDWQELTKPPIKGWKLPSSPGLMKDMGLSTGDDGPVIGPSSKVIGKSESVHENGSLTKTGEAMSYIEEIINICQGLSPEGQMNVLKEAKATAFDESMATRRRPTQQRA